MVGMRILIADDNATMRSMLEKFAGRIGRFDIDFAGNGKEALRFYREKHHQLVIIDNFMPELNGIDVLRELRGDPLLDNTHVMMITGEVNRQLVTTIRTEFLKIDDLIAKPIDFEKMTAKVTAVVSRFNRKNRANGPLLRAADPVQAQTTKDATLTADVVDRGSLAIIELNGKLVNSNRSVIAKTLKDMQTIFAKTIVIDINGVDEIDDFGCGTLAIMSGWLSLNEKEVLLACDDCATKERITSLGISKLVPEYKGCLDII
ncbi:MAG: response regulator [Rhodospirillaceae bacterium]